MMVEVQLGLDIVDLFSCSMLPSHLLGESRISSRRMSSKHDMAGAKKNVLILARSSVTLREKEVFSLADSDILTLVCASPAPASDGDGPGKNGVQTKHLRRRSLPSPDQPPACMDLIQFFW